MSDTTPIPTFTLFQQLELLQEDVERLRLQIVSLCDSIGKPTDRASLDLREQLQRAVSFLEQAADHLMPEAAQFDPAGSAPLPPGNS
jgi:hypothetical protein